MDTHKRPTKPFIVWKNYGYEGWSFHEFDLLEDALANLNLADGDVLTRLMIIMAVEADTKCWLITEGGS